MGASVANFREFTGPVKKTLVPLPQLPGQLPGSDVGTGRSAGDGSAGDRGGRNAGRRRPHGPAEAPRPAAAGDRRPLAPQGPDRLLRRRG